MELTLASYNIHSGIGCDGRFDLHRIGEVLRLIDADLIGLQEVGDFQSRTSREDHPEHLAELLGMHMAFGPNVVLNDRRYGNAILSRLPILRSRNYDLSVGSREPRGALRCDIDLGKGSVLHLFCLHLGLTSSERRRQETLLLTADILRDAARQDPVIVCGDFNYWWGGQVPALVRQAIHDVSHMLGTGSRARTYHSRFPMLRLDRIFVDEGIRPISLQAYRTDLSLVASDHLPLVMKFEAPVAERLHPSGLVELTG